MRRNALTGRVRAHPGMYGDRPSEFTVHAAGAVDVLELGCGHGRDALYFARCGFTVRAADFSSVALRKLRTDAEAAGLAEKITTAIHDVRDPLPLPDSSVDAVFAHMHAVHGPFHPGNACGDR